jgi:type IX secretion system PorP/SprF family membrane protein
MKTVRLHIVLLILFLNFSVRAQQDIQLGQQHLSRLNINPAATGTSNYANAYLFARQQWIGFEGAPSTQMFNAHGYVDEIRSGFGLSVVNDIVGRNKFLNLMFAYAYHIQVGYERFFSLGLSAGLVHRRFGGNLITGEQELCPDLLEMLRNGKSVYRPNVNFGFIYSAPKFVFGLSATHLTRYLFNEDWFQFPLHGYVFMEFGIDFNESLRFTPRIQVMSAFGSTMFKDTFAFFDNVDLLYDVGGTFSLDDRFWIGASFRAAHSLPGTGILESGIAPNSVVGMFGINLGPNIRVGYSYDFKLGRTFQNVRNFGTHEIILNYRMRVAEVEASEQTPRFFE